MSLFIHLSIHFILSFLAGFLVSFYFDNPFLIISAAILAGFLVDIDHLFDYFLTFKKFNLSRFLSSQQFIVSGIVMKIFHAWELVFILLILALFSWQNLLVQGMLISASFSLFIHLVSDCIINKEPVYFYFFLYRFKNNFSIEKFENKPVTIKEN